MIKYTRNALMLAAIFGLATTNPLSAYAGTIKKKIRIHNGPGQVDKNKIRGISQLTKSDCKLLLGGEIVYVTDGRCGASGAYCKSATVSACISQ